MAEKGGTGIKLSPGEMDALMKMQGHAGEHAHFVVASVPDVEKKVVGKPIGGLGRLPLIGGLFRR